MKKLTDDVRNVDFDDLKLANTDYQYSELNQIAEKFDDLLIRLEQLIKNDYKSQIMLNKFRPVFSPLPNQSPFSDEYPAAAAD